LAIFNIDPVNGSGQLDRRDVRLPFCHGKKILQKRLAGDAVLIAPVSIKIPCYQGI
jgi:hypothetical protein